MTVRFSAPICANRRKHENRPTCYSLVRVITYSHSVLLQNALRNQLSVQLNVVTNLGCIRLYPPINN